jgi:hypothetical protein
VAFAAQALSSPPLFQQIDNMRRAFTHFVDSFGFDTKAIEPFSRAMCCHNTKAHTNQIACNARDGCFIHVIDTDTNCT